MALLLESFAGAQPSPWQPTSPELKIARATDNVTVSWLISPFDQVLETADDLPSVGVWTRPLLATSVVEDQIAVTVPAGNSRQFFRLAGPVSVPIFQFGIFYAVDLEISPGPNMTITGPVHCNANIFAAPINALTFQSRVTAANTIFTNQSPLDPSVRPSLGPVTFLGGRRSGVTPLSLAIGTNNSPAALHQIIEIPPDSESPTSDLGRQRYYNKADMIVKVTDAGITVTSGRVNNFATTVPWASAKAFISTNVSFVNKRENKTVRCVQISVSHLKTWSATNATIRPILPQGDVSVLYVADQRTQSTNTESGVRLVNGSELPPLGLTVASPNPVYIQGNYNASAAVLGQNDTTGTLPASVIADTITILSVTWLDASGGSSLSSRIAFNTTVNAALLGGIVPSDGTNYSGGFINFPRYLENWSGAKTFTYNGSMVALFYSQIAKAPWGGSNVDSPPLRQWAFDRNFLDPTKLPPGTPDVGVVAPSN